jgi:hypothetical protein
MTPSQWKFEDPPNVACFTTQAVVNGGKPILYVSHDEDDGAWQFHSGDDVRSRDAMILALEKIVQMDASVEELSDLPCGWVATRATPRSTWVRAQHE